MKRVIINQRSIEASTEADILKLAAERGIDMSKPYQRVALGNRGAVEFRQ